MDRSDKNSPLEPINTNDINLINTQPKNDNMNQVDNLYKPSGFKISPESNPRFANAEKNEHKHAHERLDSENNCEYYYKKQNMNLPWYKKKFSLWDLRFYIGIIFIMLIVIIVLSVVIDKSNFNNADPYGNSIRFNQSRDDTGAIETNLNQRMAKHEPFVIEPLTSNPEPPNIAEYYGIEANLKNGSVMIDRENFENSALSLDQLQKANKGL